MLDFNKAGGAGYMQLLSWILSLLLLVGVIYLCYTRSFRRALIAPDLAEVQENSQQKEEAREKIIEQYYTSSISGKKCVHQIAQDEVKSAGNLEGEESNRHICAVCLDAYKANDFTVSSSDCQHIFHKDCLVSYMKKCKIEEGSSPCPVCRQPFLPRLELPSLEDRGDDLEMVERGRDPPGQASL